MRIVIIIPAAGASSRMRGRDKLLENVDGVPLLRRCATQALSTGWPVVVTLSDTHPERQAALEGLEIAQITVQNAQNGMGASIRDAMLRVPDHTDAVMILPADMPDLTTEDLQDVMSAYSQEPGTIWRAASDTGEPGHPVVFPKRLFENLRGLENAEGARSVLSNETVNLLPLPDRRAVTDLDTPEDWAIWRRRTEQAAP